MNFRGNGAAAVEGNTAQLHILTHTLLEAPDILAAVNAELAKRKHQAINYGQLSSGLHLHYLLHAIGLDWKLYAEVGREEFAIHSVSRRTDSIGRVDRALVFHTGEK